MARVNKASTTRAKSGAKIKQVVAALEESQEKLRKMFESVTDGISVVDLNGVIIEVNQERWRCTASRPRMSFWEEMPWSWLPPATTSG